MKRDGEKKRKKKRETQHGGQVKAKWEACKSRWSITTTRKKSERTANRNEAIRSSYLSF